MSDDKDSDGWVRLDLKDALLRLRANDDTLTNLDLGGNNIGAEGARALAEALKENTTLTDLNLGNNNIGAEGARALAEDLKESTALTQLNLSGNEIGAEGARALAKMLGNIALTQLTLWKNNIADKGARALAEALEENIALTHLDLRGNNIGAKGARALAEALEENTALTQLGLSYNNIGAKGARALAEALKESTPLTHLNLTGNEIGPEGARALADPLKGNTALIKLGLSYNNIGAEGARAEAIVKGLTSRNTLLRLQRNEVATQGFSFYFGKSGNGDMETNSLCIKETVWKAATTGDGLVLRLVQDVLQEYLAECGKGGVIRLEKGHLVAECGKRHVIKLEKDSLKKMFDESTNSEGSLLLHLAAALDSEEALEMCKFLVDEIGVDFDTTTDDAGLTARDIAQGNPRASKWAKSVGTFLGRYYLEEKGRYKSPTCIVHFAVDVEKSKGDPDRNVAIKIMENPDQFEHEFEQRLGDYSKPESGVDIKKVRYRFDENHVVPLLRYHDERIKGGNCLCLVMIKGQRNLHEVISYEGIAGSDVNAIIFYAVDSAQALQHLHSKLHRTIHGDFKPKNIVRINGDYKLIDFDASVIIGDTLTDKYSSGYLSPELARWVFRTTETLEGLLQSEDALKKDLSEAMNDSCGAVVKIAGELENVQQKIKQKVKENEDSSLVTPEDKPRANVEMDIWSYGVVMYQMLTDRSLFNCDKYDNLLNDQEKQKLVSWEGISDDDLTHVLKECEDQDLVDSAKDLLRQCLSNDKRPKSFNQVLDHPFLKRKNLLSQKLIEGQREMKENQQEIMDVQKVTNLKLDKTLDLLLEMQIHLKNVSTSVNTMLRNFDAPKLLFIFPVEPSRKDWLTSLVKTKVKVIFICPVTYSIPRDGKNKPMGYIMEYSKAWLLKYGPALKMSLDVLRFAFAVGRLAGLPLPDLSSVGKSTNLLHVMNDNLSAAMEDEAPDITELADTANLCVSVSGEDESSVRLKRDKLAIVKASYDEVKQIAEQKGDPQFLKTGLSKVLKDDCVEYVLNDPKIKALYEEHGHECIGLTASELSDLGADLDVVVKEGELDKNSNKITRHRKRDYLMRRKKESLKRSYFVLRKNGLLTYYQSKEERDKDPLGGGGKTKAKRVIKIHIEDPDETGSFRISYHDDEPNQQEFKVPATSGQKSPADRDAVAKEWVQAWTKAQPRRYGLEHSGQGLGNKL